LRLSLRLRPRFLTLRRRRRTFHPRLRLLTRRRDLRCRRTLGGTRLSTRRTRVLTGRHGPIGSIRLLRFAAQSLGLRLGFGLRLRRLHALTRAGLRWRAYRYSAACTGLLIALTAVVIEVVRLALHASNRFATASRAATPAGPPESAAAWIPAARFANRCRDAIVPSPDDHSSDANLRARCRSSAHLDCASWSPQADPDWSRHRGCPCSNRRQARRRTEPAAPALLPA